MLLSLNRPQILALVEHPFDEVCTNLMRDRAEATFGWLALVKASTDYERPLCIPEQQSHHG